MSEALPATGRSRWLAFAVLCSMQLMVIVDTSIVTIALRSIQRDLGFSQAGLAWVVNAYTIAFGGLLLLSGRLGDLVGRKRMFVTGVVVFTAASVFCGLSGSQEMLVVARFVQGGGAAMSAAVAMGIVITIFREPREQAKAIAVFSFVAAAGASIGIIAGGILTEGISWRWVFFVNAPIGIAATVLALRFVDADRGLGLRAGADVVGAVLVTSGLMLGVYTIVSVDELGWGSLRMLGFGLLSVALLVGFVARQAIAALPLVPLRIFRSRAVAGANLVQALMIAGMFAFNFLAALYLQLVLGYGPVAASFAFLPISVVLAVVSLGFAARLNMRVGPRIVLVVGLTLVVAALALAARAPVPATYAVDVLPMAVLLGAGAGLAMPAVMTLAMSTATPADAGTASGLVGTSATVGSALGLAVMAALAASRTRHLLADGQDLASALNGGYQRAFGVSAAVVAAAAVLAATVPRAAASPPGPAGPPSQRTAPAARMPVAQAPKPQPAPAQAPEP